MMKNLLKTLSKTPKLLKSLTPNYLYPVPNPYFSTNFPLNQQQSNIQSQIDQNNDEIERAKMKTLTKPTQIPYQSKVVNWVHLIGTVKKPIKFLTCSDGKSWATTLVSQEQKPSNLGMPVIFQGDLAYTAVMHLKENDMVYIAGHLSAEPFPISSTDKPAYVQVLVHDFYFVRGVPSKPPKPS